MNNIKDRWEKYEGDFINDYKEGFGILHFGSGEKYCG